MRWRRRAKEEPTEIEPTGTVTLVPRHDEASTLAPGEDAPVADPALLSELSRAFADDRAGRGDADGGGVDDSEDPGRPTISIGDADDDLPDPVYLDEALEQGDASSGPVFIDDDGSSDAVLPKDATTPGIEPRLRQRRIGVRRAASRKRLWWVGGIAAVLAVVIAVLAVLGSSLFAVDDVTVRGNVYTDPAQLQEIVDDLEGSPTLTVDTREFEERLESIPWVEDARVRTDFPRAASIEIRERTPVAAVPGTDGRVRVLDAEGRILAVIDGQPVALAWISGPGALDAPAGEFAPIGYQAAAALVTKLTPTIRGQLDSLMVTADGADLVLLLNRPAGPLEVRFGSAIGDNAQIEKLVRLERALEDVADRPATVIDVATPEVTVR
jgi:cell division protein FtsQ